jgi:hypothetical protein
MFFEEREEIVRFTGIECVKRILNEREEVVTESRLTVRFTSPIKIVF